ncbi:MAG: hypothetical protein V4864_01010 [Pseudomonadota bacterium]
MQITVIDTKSGFGDFSGQAKSESFAERQKEFNEKHQDWIDEQNRIVDEFGVFGEEYRVW